MKWFLFFVPVMFLFSCKNETKPKSVEIINPQQVSYNDTVKMPWEANSEFDSGYFKGKIPEKLDGLEVKDTTLLGQFLSSLISKKDIILLNDETLSHTVFVNQRKKTRFDTLRNDNVVINSIYDFGKKEFQKATINGSLLNEGEGFDFDETSFRYFSFHGKAYYYIEARNFYSRGTSIGNVTYHLIYSLEQKQLSCFETCRFSPMLFGDVNGDENLDYLDFNNSDFCTTVPSSDSVTIQLYSCNNKGKFVLQKDTKGIPYFIDGNTRYNNSQDSFNVKRKYWPFQ